MGPHTVYELRVHSPEIKQKLGISKCFDGYAPVRVGDSVAVRFGDDTEVVISLDVKEISYHPDRQAMYVKLADHRVPNLFMQRLLAAQEEDGYVHYEGWYPKDTRY